MRFIGYKSKLVLIKSHYLMHEIFQTVHTEVRLHTLISFTIHWFIVSSGSLGSVGSYKRNSWHFKLENICNLLFVYSDIIILSDISYQNNSVLKLYVLRYIS